MRSVTPAQFKIMSKTVFNQKDVDFSKEPMFFGEDQGRYLFCSEDSKSFVREARLKSVPIKKVGVVGGHDIIVDGESIALKELRDAHESWLPNLMST